MASLPVPYCDLAVFTFIDVFLRYVTERHDSVFNSPANKRPFISTDVARRAVPLQ